MAYFFAFFIHDYFYINDLTNNGLSTLFCPNYYNLSRLEELGYSYSNTYEQGLVIIDNTKGRKIYLQKFFGDSYSHNKVIDKILDYENKKIAQF